MSGSIKLALKIVVALVALVLLLWVGVASYVNTHKEQVLEAVTAQLNENITGELTIESMEPAFLKGFPGISVSLKNVLLRDSLYDEHHHDLLKAAEVFVDVNIFSILKGNPRIRNISVSNGRIYLFTDEEGYSNTRLFKAKPGTQTNQKSDRKISSMNFKNVVVIYENKLKSKYFRFFVRKFAGDIDYKGSNWTARADLATKAESLTFNTARGSFISNMELRTTLKLRYDKAKHQLFIPEQALKLNKDELLVGGTFDLNERSPMFNLRIRAKRIAYKNAVSMLSTNLHPKLSKYNISGQMAVDVRIQGKLKGRNIPLVKAGWTVKNAEVFVLGERISNCSFTGTFTNELDPKLPRLDPNSGIGLKSVKGTWSSIPFTAAKVNVINLSQPVFQGHFKSNFPLTRINALSGSQTFAISSGQASLDLVYKAALLQKSKVEPYIYGAVNLRAGAFTYLPRKLRFRNVHGTIQFKGQHLALKNIGVNTAQSRLTLNGFINNFVNLYYTDPKKMVFDLKVTSPQINLIEYLSFLGRRQAARSASGSRRSTARLFRQLDQVLEQSNIHLAINVNRLHYKRFNASHINSDVLLRESGISIKNIGLSHAGGSLTLQGEIDQRGNSNEFSLTSKINRVDVKKLFYAFEDFGQDALTHENLKGLFYARSSIRGTIRENGQIVPRSIHGKVTFDFQNGSLINFEPMQKIGNFAFPNRNFSDISFSQLENTLEIQGSKIIIPPMTIRSSVLNLFVSGVYNLNEGTNISLKVPLRNPEKDKNLPDSVQEKRITRGIVLNLSAVDGDNGKVAIRLGTKEEDDIEEDKQEREKKRQKEQRRELRQQEKLKEEKKKD
ncbi:AsmA-like C-terminal region-containing protein [Pedobacter sp. SYSU D00535]|uniref:AsmA-like C-terminal region-containing protein n=1 Tax=Pedobacter sp. SYSU D00535 TaxID=2810308 RepID=UPI001A96BE77|nr:AsmA-like C-terminal region-containing protein [Pedobacter sp. SYSU D00535]